MKLDIILAIVFVVAGVIACTASVILACPILRMC